MSGRTIAPSYRRATGSALIEALANALTLIKREDGHTDLELATVLGKDSQDSGKAYRTGFAEMPVTAFLRGCEAWNGRFANEALALVGMKLVPLSAGDISDRSMLSSLTRLLLELSVALEDGEVDDGELAAMRTAIETAGQAVDRLRERMKLRAA